MKTKLKLSAICHLLVSTCLSTFAQGTAFTYQGRLNDGGGPVRGVYDFRFKLFQDSFGNTQAGGTVLVNGISMTNGLFMATIDFGAGIFNGSNYWLEVDVRTNGGGSYASLNPLQAVTPSPYAIFANTASNLSGTISSANLSGAYSGAVTLNNGGNNFSGSFNGNGSNVTNVNAATLGGLGANQFWKITGNSSTVAGVNFLGTADNQPLELRVNGQRVLRLEPTTNSPNLIGGFSGNYVTNGATGAVIGGGGAATVFGGNGLNRITDDFGVIGGGADNRAGNTNADPTDAYYATVGGGVHNVAEGIATFIGGGAENRVANNNSTIAGGYQNKAGGYVSTIGGGYGNTNTGYISFIGGGGFNLVGDAADTSTIGGGWHNQIIGSASGTVAGTIAGGYYNNIYTNGDFCAIGGGFQNNIQADAYGGTIGGGLDGYLAGKYATIPGGFVNTATGFTSFAAGHRARAIHDGAFVWADSLDADFNSTATNQFSVRATGGVRLVTGGAGMTLDGQAVALRAGGNNFTGAQTITGSDAAQLVLQNSADSRSWYIYDENFGGSGALIFQPGSPGVGAYIRRSDGNYIVNSDARLKEDITPIGEVLDRVLQLRPVSYHFRTAPGGTPLSLGLIAQEVEPLFPDVVGEHNGIKSLAYSELIPVTIRAIQELNQKMDSENAMLREELKRRDAENAELKQRLEKLERLMERQTASR